MQIGADKLVGKKSINLLCHTKPATYIISIIINAPAVAYTHSYELSCRSCTPKQIDLTSVFVIIAALTYCVSMLLLTSAYKSTYVQYKHPT